MRGKGKRYTCTKPQGFQIGLIILVLHVWKQRFPFIAVEFFHQPYGFGQQFDTAELISPPFTTNSGLTLLMKMVSIVH